MGLHVVDHILSVYIVNIRITKPEWISTYIDKHNMQLDLSGKVSLHILE